MLEFWERTDRGKKLTAALMKEVHERDAAHRQSDDDEKKTTPALLRRMKPQAELDLHGCTAAEAQQLILDFLKTSAEQGMKKVQIVHGKGNHSGGGRSVLKDVTKACIEISPYAGQTGTPPAAEGGSGAVWVALKQRKS